MNPIEAVKKIICTNEIYALQEAQKQIAAQEEFVAMQRNELSKQNADIATLANERNALAHEVSLYKSALESALKDTDELLLADELEKKYPIKNDVRYICRYVYVQGAAKKQQIKSCDIDPRMFFQKDSSIEDIAKTILGQALIKDKVQANDWDELAWRAEDWIKKNITYVSDKSVFDLEEYWQFAYETLKLKTADCEDGAILLANLLLELGIPAHRVRLNAGNVSLGGHAYVTYCRKSDNKFAVLDWCFETTRAKIPLRQTHKEMRDYYTVWFSWTGKNIFSSTPKEKWA